ncbi:carcinoembryonic antigen-related cell adhesion molecule 1-like isoform X2 [Parambassis ranga]|uniref:Carcinoembryonic antigen-related cell adhesion molecule 1-like isoform X2 n=1 Tax=Parambassis ranga TaxID=210632 RepID=A0A6P7JXP5_9TELE|nr:carcinoembryonic antigen-related cell adhesion molecule 1-like isoform X2 [Parambassis ranga]
MEKAVRCIVVLGIISGLSEAARVFPDGPFNASVGETVTLRTTLTPTNTPFTVVSWKFGSKDIISSHSVNFTAPEYEDRITFFPSTASLELRGLTLNDSGEYTVSITPADSFSIVGTTRLDVFVLVSNVTLTSNSTDLVEFSSSVRLSCSSSGSSLSFWWMNSSSEVAHIDRVQITDGGATLTIVNVTRYDQGPFRCHVFNPVSNGTSDPVNLSISYGPENVRIKGPNEIIFKHILKLSCSADSTPAPSYTWILNDQEIPYNTSEFIKEEADYSDSGDYTCRAQNDITERSSSSAVHHVAVTDLSDGAIAGIVIACLIVAFAGVAGGYVFFKKNIKAKPHSGNTEQENMYENISVIYDKKI